MQKVKAELKQVVNKEGEKLPIYVILTLITLLLFILVILLCLL